MQDVELVRSTGRGRVDVTVGSALDIFGGTLPFADMVRWHEQQQGGHDHAGAQGGQGGVAGAAASSQSQARS